MNAASPTSSPAVGGDFKRLLLLAGIINYLYWHVCRSGRGE